MRREEQNRNKMRWNVMKRKERKERKGKERKRDEMERAEREKREENGRVVPQKHRYLILRFYFFMQVESVQNGTIPVNKHGNVEVWDYNELLVPKGAR